MLSALIFAQVFLGLFLIFVFNNLKTKLKSEQVLFWYLILLIGRNIFQYLGALDVVLLNFPYIIFIAQPLFYLDAVFLFLFVRSVLDKDLFDKWTWWALLPFFLYAGFMLLTAIQSIEVHDELAQWAVENNGNKSKEIKLHGIIYILSVIAYNIIMYLVSMRLYRKHRSNNVVSSNSINQLNQRWQDQFLIWWFVLICLPVATILLFLLLKIELGFDYELFYPLGILLLTFVFGLRKVKIKIDELRLTDQKITPRTIIQQTPKYGSLKLSEERLGLIRQKIENLIEQENIYLDKELNLNKFAEQVGEKPYLISQVVNTIFDKNFKELINGHRIAHAKKLLRDNPDYKMIHIAFDSGFKSKTSFNTSFKSITGLTPSQYKSQE